MTMKKKIAVAVVALVVIIAGIFVFQQNRTTSIETLEDGQIGVETTVSRECDLQTFQFICSAVFEVKQEDTGTFYIDSVKSPFIQRKKAPSDYTFSPADTNEDPEVICMEKGQTYVVQRWIQVKKAGSDVKKILVAAQFTVSPETGELSVEDYSA